MRPIFCLDHIQYPNLYPLCMLAQPHQIDGDPQADKASFFVEANVEPELIDLRPNASVCTALWFLRVKRIQTRSSFELSEIQPSFLLAPLNKWYEREDRVSMDEKSLCYQGFRKEPKKNRRLSAELMLTKDVNASGVRKIH